MLHDHYTSISISGEPICNRRHRSYVRRSGELYNLTNGLVDRTGAFGIEFSIENSNIMTSGTNNISADNIMKLEVTSFKYLGATLCKDGTAEIRIRIASAMASNGQMKEGLSSKATPPASQASSRRTSLLSPPSSFVAVKH